MTQAHTTSLSDMQKLALQKLQQMRTHNTQALTTGLSDPVIQEFLGRDPHLAQAILEADVILSGLRSEYPQLLKLSEAELIKTLQAGYVNFYPSDQTNPYVPIAARGPWIITAYGAVLHDSGGYGMLGFGHAPQAILQAMQRNQVMANVMTANFSQVRLIDRLQREIGHTRGKPVYSKFLCMNSGSEAMTVALRISDLKARKITESGAAHSGKRIMFLTLKGGFHGRTERPAQASNSSRKNYDHLATFRGLQNNHTVEPNNLDQLRQAFAWAQREGVFFEAMLMEPVMGEGDPGKAISVEFYSLARQLTKEAGTLLIVDSIQAGIRAQGVLSICDYPGFQGVEAPDMESYSKAVNAGQFPLSILALNENAAALYVRGIYGNTKTTNPRALDVAVTVLDSITPELRRNIVERGAEILKKFEQLRSEFPEVITKVQGTGLLCSLEVSPNHFKILGPGQLEEFLRCRGIGVIHGGANSLRFTPHFEISSAEIDLIVEQLRQAFRRGPLKS